MDYKEMWGYLRTEVEHQAQEEVIEDMFDIGWKSACNAILIAMNLCEKG